MVIRVTPKRLKKAAITIAVGTPRHLVDTQVAIALGASVQPLTRITPRVSKTVIKSAGFEIQALRNSTNPIVKRPLSSYKKPQLQ
jgi:hypothetical protein